MSPDLVFEILSNTRRRMVLFHLRQYGGTVTVQTLAGEIAALENEVEVDDLSRQQRKRVYVSLYQTHLPKLEETGIVEYDDDSGDVRLTDRAGEIDTYLTPTNELDYPWQLHYLLLAVSGGLFLVLSFVGVSGFAAVPTIVLGIGLMVGFAASAVVQYYRHRRLEETLPAELVKHDR